MDFNGGCSEAKGNLNTDDKESEENKENCLSSLFQEMFFLHTKKLMSSL